MHKPDNLLEYDVTEQLAWDQRLDSSRIVVKAKRGDVTLSGTVPTYYDSTIATDDAWFVGGVKSLTNELLVGLVGEAIADADVAAACRAAIAADKHVPKGGVGASVTDGWVTLTGEVRHHFQRQAAEHAVRGVDGVLGLTDKVEITTDPIPGDVVDRINQAFARNAIIDDSQIAVTSSGHTVFLDGTTGSHEARRAAENAAWAAPGVDDVIDRLAIVP